MNNRGCVLDEPMLEVPDAIASSDDDDSSNDTEPVVGGIAPSNDVDEDDSAEIAMSREVEAAHWRVILDDMEYATPPFQPAVAPDAIPPPIEDERPPNPPPPSDPSMLGAEENAHWKTYLDELHVKEPEVDDASISLSDTSVEI